MAPWQRHAAPRVSDSGRRHARARVRAEFGPPPAVRPARSSPPQSLHLRVGVFTLSGEVLNVLNRKNEYNVESTLLTVARTGQYSSGLRRGFPVAPSIGLS